MGWRGSGLNDWDYDFSLAYGRHTISYFLTNTINPQLAHDYAAGVGVRNFNPGGHEEEDLIVNLDFTKQFDTLSMPASLAMGLEYRNEQYTIIAGDAASSFVYYDDEGEPALAKQGLAIGSNGYVGFPASIAGSFDSEVVAAYGDLRIMPSVDFYTDLAVRYEDYQEFGDTLNVKIASRWQTTPDVAIRAAAGTGFRAPTVGQANTIKVTTEFTGDELSDTATLPATHPAAILKGAKPLKPEESVHVNLGMVYDVGDTLWSLDLFSIDVTNRIGTTSNLELSAAEQAGLPEGQIYDAVRYFTNDFDSETKGIDLRFERALTRRIGAANFRANISYLETRITDSDPAVLNPVDRQLIEDSLPKLRGNFDLTSQRGKWQGLVRARYYGGYWENAQEAADSGVDADDKWLFDVEAGYDVTDTLTIALGADNLFDEYPERDPYGGEIGNLYLVDSPFGFNGAFYYLRATAEF